MPDFFTLDHGFKWGVPATHFPLMRSLIIVEADPFIQIGLQLRDGLVELLAECDLINSCRMVLWKRSQMPLVWGGFTLIFV